MTENKLSLLAPAKLNLFLHVTGRLPNGYHTLQSLFVLIGLYDEIELKVRRDGQIVRTGDVIGDPEKDLCVRAAQLLKSRTNCPLGVEICVKKTIPAGAGMGGGSSDAATTLMGLNHLWDLHLHRQELIEMAPKLGADVPFFLLGTNAWVEGIGEKLTPIEVPETSFAVIWPGVHQGTPEIFSHKDLTRDTKYVKIPNFESDLTEETLRNLGHNDLEPIFKKVNPEVSRLLDNFQRFRLTGSGSAAFALMTENEAEGVFKDLPENWQHFFVKSLKIHPVSSALPC